MAPLEKLSKSGCKNHSLLEGPTCTYPLEITVRCWSIIGIEPTREPKEIGRSRAIK